MKTVLRKTFAEFANDRKPNLTGNLGKDISKYFCYMVVYGLFKKLPKEYRYGYSERFSYYEGYIRIYDIEQQILLVEGRCCVNDSAHNENTFEFGFSGVCNELEEKYLVEPLEELAKQMLEYYEAHGIDAKGEVK